MGVFHKREDITGKKFNMLTVLNYMETDHNGKALWLCECDCGELKVIAGYELKKGQKSCGCVKAPPLELVGQKFARWTVLEEKEKDKHGKRRFLCECLCGNKKVVDGSSLRNGLSKSCGCLQKIKLERFKKIKKEKKCKLSDCDSKHFAKGFCQSHYNKFANNRIDLEGNPIGDYKPRPKISICRYPGCKTIGNKKNGLKKGLCGKHRKWATKGIIDLDTCEILDPSRIPQQRLHINCKVQGCNKKHRRNGFCDAHSKSYRNGVIDKNGKRMFGKRAKYDYSKKPKCCVRTCDFRADGTSRQNRLVKGFCQYHYDLHKKGYFNEFGMKIKEFDFYTREELIKNFIKYAKKAGRKRAIKITWEGETKTIKTWSKLTKIKAGTIKSRYKAGLPVDLIFLRGDLRSTREYREYLKKREASARG